MQHYESPICFGLLSLPDSVHAQRLTHATTQVWYFDYQDILVAGLPVFNCDFAPIILNEAVAILHTPQHDNVKVRLIS